MDFLKESFSDVLRKRYATLEGKASRKEYWGFTLIYLGVLAALYGARALLEGGPLVTVVDIVLVAYSAVMLMPEFAAAVRRLRDAGLGAGCLLLLLIPIIGWTLLGALLCLPSRKSGEGSTKNMGNVHKGSSPVLY